MRVERRKLERYMEDRKPASPKEALDIVLNSDYADSVKVNYIGSEHFRQYLKK